MHRKGRYFRKRQKGSNSHMCKQAQIRGLVLKVVVKKPKKQILPTESAYVWDWQRETRELRIYRVKTQSTGTQHCAGGGREAADVPGVKLRCIRGKYDLGPCQEIAVAIYVGNFIYRWDCVLYVIVKVWHKLRFNHFTFLHVCHLLGCLFEICGASRDMYFYSNTFRVPCLPWKSKLHWFLHVKNHCRISKSWITK